MRSGASSSQTAEGLRQRGGATTARPSIASRRSSGETKAGQDSLKVKSKGKQRASNLASVQEHRRESTSGSDDLEDDEEDYLPSRSSGRDEEPYGKFANRTDDSEGHDAEHTFAGPAHYLPLVVAIVPPLGAVLHGRAEAWTDALILLIVAFYLYQVVRLPWELYYASRTRRINAAEHIIAEADDEAAEAVPAHVTKRRQLAASELRQTELLSLLFCLISPFLGSYLLYYIRSALSEPDRYINPFNIRLFVLASGVKPWLHFFKLVKSRSLFLQSEVHYPTSTVNRLSKRVRSLEAELDDLKALYATKADVKLLRDGVDVPLTALSKAVRRYERKEEYARLSNEDKFAVLMQRQEEMLVELDASAREMETMRQQQEKMGSGMRALRYIFSGPAAEGKDGQHMYVWYERGPFFYIFLPLIASNKILDATGRLFSTVKHQVGPLERSGMIEAGNSYASKQENRK